MFQFQYPMFDLQEQGQWGLEELSRAVGVSQDVLRRRIMFWVNQGVITEARTLQVLAEFT